MNPSILEREKDIIVRTPYDKIFAIKMRELGGTWDTIGKSWILPKEKIEKTKMILEENFGTYEMEINKKVEIISEKSLIIEIKNLRTEKPKYIWDIRVDRTSGSILGNPYYCNENDNKRREYVCNEYIKYFKEKLNGDHKFVNELNRLLNIVDTHKKINLFCWCAPKRCHAETIREWLMEKLK